MNDTQVFNVVAIGHLIMLSMWGGVVATEAVVEIYPFKKREFAEATSAFHYWIDLLVELPLVLAVIATGIGLVYLSDQITRLHIVKIGFGSLAIGVNLFCIAVVLRRDRRRLAGAPSGQLRKASLMVLVCFAVGLLCAAAAAVLGFSLGLTRVG
jgi:hypothetical protein